MLLSTSNKALLPSGLALLLSFPHIAEAKDSQIHEAQEEAFLETTHYPHIGGEVVMELQNEYTTNSDDPATDGYNNIFVRTEVAPTLALNENLRIDGVLVFENIQDRNPNESNFFDNEGAFIEEIKLNYENGSWSAFAGKFNPAFGIAWDYRGIWGEDFAEDYEITERIGFGGGYAFEVPNGGTHTLNASTFFADTTLLSESTITKRGHNTKADGGVSNTESFESFAVSLDGDNVAGVDGLYYKLGYQNQAEGDADAGNDRQTGYAATLGHVMPVTERVVADGLLEYVDLNNVDGVSNTDSQYLTASLITTVDDAWNVTLSFTDRDTDVSGGADADDHLFQISGGYDFGQGTTAQIGYRQSEESGADTDIIGGLVRHIVEF